MITSIDVSCFLYSSLTSDPDLGELVEMFAEEVPAKVEAIQDAYQKRENEQLLRLVHQLKGSAGSYGFAAITPFAARLEQSLKTSADPNQIHCQLQDLLAICNRVRPGFDATKASSN